MKADYAKAFPALELMNEDERIRTLEARVEEKARHLEQQARELKAREAMVEDREKKYERQEETINEILERVAAPEKKFCAGG